MTNQAPYITPEQLSLADQFAKRQPYPCPVIHHESTSAGELYRVRDREWILNSNSKYNSFLAKYLRDTVGNEWITTAARKNSTQPLGRLMRAAADYSRATSAQAAALNLSHFAQCCAERELNTLAHDLITLDLISSRPDSLIVRLKRRNDYQGVRYEIAIAASLARAGFQIEWLDKEQKSAELLATHDVTGETFAVEAKSRHRGGVFSSGLQTSTVANLKADIATLYKGACRKQTQGHPLAIFIDAQIPYRVGSNSPLLTIEGLKDSMEQVRMPTPENRSREFFSRRKFSWLVFRTVESCSACQ